MTISTADHVSLISLNEIPAALSFTAALFSALGKAGVNVDMISQSLPRGKTGALSFTVGDEAFGAALGVIAALRAEYPDVSSAVSSSNSKFTVSEPRMRATPGMAAELFAALERAGVDLRMITTAETEISVLVTDADRAVCAEALKTLDW